MITEIVTFAIPEGMSRDEVVALYEKSAPLWRDHPQLVHKSYLYDAEAGLGGGVYLWPSREAARAAHDAAFEARIRDLFGDTPRYRYFETPVVVDNAAR